MNWAAADGHAPLATFCSPAQRPPPRGADEGADLVRDPSRRARARRPEETSTAGARVMRSASATLPASSPPDSMNGTPGSRPSSSVQSNGLPRPPGRVASRGARASKMQPVGDLGVEPDRRKVGALADRQRLHHRQPEACAHHRRRAPGVSCAVQLQQVGLERLDRWRRGTRRRRRPRARPCGRARAPARPARARPRSRDCGATAERTRSRPGRRRRRARPRPRPASSGRRF